MKILVTGGAGFIGSALIRHIINFTHDQIINVDKLTYAGNLESLVAIAGNHRYFFSKIDICNRGALSAIFADYQPDLIMHLAAESHVDRSIDGPGAFIETNIIGTYTLLEVSRAYWDSLEIERKNRFRFLHVSTDEVYGDLEDPEILFTETTPYAPSSPYSASKASSDHLARAWYRTYGFPSIVTNCSNNYGPYHFPEKLIPLMILNALECRPLPVYGNGKQIRDWLYVEDHVRALYLVAKKGIPGQTYNIGGLNEKTNIEVVNKVCLLLDELAPIVKNSNFSRCNHGSNYPIIKYSQLIEFVEDRPGHDKRYAINASKIGREIGWRPKETFETGLRKTVSWYLHNTIWTQRVQDGSYARERLGVDV